MKVLYNFEQFAKLKNYWNSDNTRYLPFKMDYLMFNNLCNLEKEDLTLSEMYDKTFLERELYDRCVSQVLFDYMRKEVYYGR